MRRQEGRRRLRFLLIAVSLVAVAVGAWGLTRTPLLDLDHVRYEGVTGADARDVESTARLAAGTAMFDLDLGAVERSLGELPWVASVTASRDWPGTVRVIVEPRVAVAVIGLEGQRSFLADADGVLIRPAATDSRLPRVAVQPSVALGEIDERAVAGIAVVLALPEDLHAWVSAVTIEGTSVDGGAPSLGLDLVGSAVVNLGLEEFIDDKLAAVRAVLEATDLSCVEVIDVAVADLPTMTRNPACEAGSTDEAAGGDA